MGKKNWMQNKNKHKTKHTQQQQHKQLQNKQLYLTFQARKGP